MHKSRTLLFGLFLMIFTVFANEEDHSLTWQSVDGTREITLMREMIDGHEEITIHYTMLEPFVDFDVVALHFGRDTYVWNADDVSTKQTRYIAGTPSVEHRISASHQLGMTPPHMQRPLGLGGNIWLAGRVQRVPVTPMMPQRRIEIVLPLNKRLVQELLRVDYAELHLYNGETGMTPEAFILNAQQLRDVQQFLA